MRNGEVDFFYYVYNDITALWPGNEGRFGQLKRLADDGRPKCWLFRRVPVYDEDVQLKHIQRGVLSGNSYSWQTFWMLRQAGVISIAREARYVPCSNGRVVIGHTKTGARIYDYKQDDLKVVRHDFPWHADLILSWLERVLKGESGDNELDIGRMLC